MLACLDLQKRFGAGSEWLLQTRFCLNCRRDALGQRLARLKWHIQPPCEKALQHLEISAREFGYPIIRQSEGRVRLRRNNGRSKDVGRKCAGGLAVDRR